MNKPLLNKKIVIPRPIDQSQEFAEKLKQLGAIPVVFPLIQVNPINQDELKKAFPSKKYDWLIFTSTVAVKFFFESISPEGITSKIAVVGTKTKEVVEQYGLKVSFTPDKATARKLAEQIPVETNEKVFLPISKIAGTTIHSLLKKKKVFVDQLAIYDNAPINYTKEQVQEINNRDIDVITFTSGSTVKNFKKLLKQHRLIPLAKHAVSIGPSTTQVAKGERIDIDRTAETHNIDGLIEEIIKLYEE